MLFHDAIATIIREKENPLRLTLRLLSPLKESPEILKSEKNTTVEKILERFDKKEKGTNRWSDTSELSTRKINFNTMTPHPADMKRMPAPCTNF